MGDPQQRLEQRPVDRPAHAQAAPQLGADRLQHAGSPAAGSMSRSASGSSRLFDAQKIVGPDHAAAERVIRVRSGSRMLPFASRRLNAGCRASMPVSRTAQRMPAVLASNTLAAASALTVIRERQMLVLASRFRLIPQTTPAAGASAGASPSNSSANPSISWGVGRSPRDSGAGRLRRSHSMDPAMRMSFRSSLGSAPEPATSRPPARASRDVSERLARPRVTHGRDHPLPPVGERKGAPEQLPERERREHHGLVEKHPRRPQPGMFRFPLSALGRSIALEPGAQRDGDAGGVRLVVGSQQHFDAIARASCRTQSRHREESENPA